MNQATPPNQSGRLPDDLEDLDANQNSNYDLTANSGGANSHYINQGAQAPDLDANAPLLKSNDLQRLNRKALIFLVGIVVLLIVGVIWIFKSATSGNDEIAKPREEKVVIPELPQGSAVDALPVEPIALYMPPTDSEIPPLPPEDRPEYSPDSMPQGPREPTLIERRINVSANDGDAADVDGALGYAGGQPNGGASSVPARQEVSSAQFINNPDTLLVRGTYVRCVLETRIITDIPGYTSCIVTEPIYSVNGRRLLLPKGSKMLGSYETDANGPRVAVIWDRITTPNGIDVNMRSPGVDSLGGAGHPGDYNAHWASRMSAALMISLISDAFKYAGEKHGPTSTTVTNGIVTQEPFESNTARTMERLANQALDRSISRPATVTINQGTVVNIYVAKDIDFSGVLAGI